MKCPHCADTALLMAERQGVEIDYCPQCRGVWLDRGELDKLLERAASPNPPGRGGMPLQRADFRDSDFGHHSGYGRHPSYKRPKSWLSEIFDGSQIVHWAHLRRCLRACGAWAVPMAPLRCS